MADKKISALTSATTPLAGTEVLPIVQSGSTVKVAISDLTAGRAVATGALTVTGALSATGAVTITTGATAGFTVTKTGAGAGSAQLYNDGNTHFKSNGTLLINYDNTNNLDFGNNKFAINGTTGTLSGGTSGTGYSFSGSAPAGSLTLNSTGNLGLGVTPSAGWSGGFYAFQIGQIGCFASKAFSAANTQTFIANNAYYNNSAGNYQYIATGSAAAKYALNAASHIWQVAATVGTADTAISFIDAMTLDASGNLGVGTTSPGARIDSKITTPTANATANILQGGDGTKTFNLFQTGSSYNYAGAYVNELWYYCNSSYAGMTFGSDGAVPIKFVSNTLERVRIDTSGNLLVGESTATGNPLAGMQVLINSGQTSIVMGHVTGTTSGTQYLGFNFNGSVIGSITQSGTTAVLYNVTSDYRLKIVVGAVSGQGARIDALKPIDYQWKEGNEQARGFLAHEFQEVYPSSVSGDKDAVDKDGKPAYQSMQASTSEVIADLVAELQSLRARVAQLESKL